jgi:hypothetical protein
MAILTEEEFSKHVGTEFCAGTGEGEVKITLTEVKTHMSDESRKQRMECFSLFFDGPVEEFLPQQNFQMRHEVMGEFELFLVPISGDQKGFGYEAVFNYFK